MIKKILFFYFSFMMMTSCNAQTRLDITSISFDTPSIEVEEVPKCDDGVLIGSTRPECTYRNVEAFSFGDFKPTNGSESTEVGSLPDLSQHSYVKFYYDKQKENITAAQITVTKNKESYAFFDYLTKKYGEPITLDEEPTPKVDEVLMGSAAYLWKNVADNRSIIASKIYYVDNKVPTYLLSVYYINPNNPEIVSTHYDIEINAYELVILQNSSDAGSLITRDIDKFKALYY